VLVVAHNLLRAWSEAWGLRDGLVRPWLHPEWGAQGADWVTGQRCLRLLPKQRGWEGCAALVKSEKIARVWFRYMWNAWNPKKLAKEMLRHQIKQKNIISECDHLKYVLMKINQTVTTQATKKWVASLLGLEEDFGLDEIQTKVDMNGLQMTNNDWAVTGLLQRNEVSWTWSTLAVMKAWGRIVLWLQRICKRHAVVKLHHVKQAAPWHSMVGQGCFDWSIVWMPRAEWTRRKNRGFMHNKQSEMCMPLITWRGAYRLAQSANNDHEKTTWKVMGRMLMLPDCTIIDIPTRRARVVCWVKRKCSCPKI
jgi:hypothetical protein